MNGGLKLRVLEAYNEKCFCCGKRHSQEDRLQVHHIIPRSEGGKDLGINLLPLCDKCHKEVHASSVRLKELQNLLKLKMLSIIIKDKNYGISEIAQLLDTNENSVGKYLESDLLACVFTKKKCVVKGSNLILWLFSKSIPKDKDKNKWTGRRKKKKSKSKNYRK